METKIESSTEQCSIIQWKRANALDSEHAIERFVSEATDELGMARAIFPTQAGDSDICKGSMISHIHATKASESLEKLPENTQASSIDSPVLFLLPTITITVSGRGVLSGSKGIGP
jgi:hypothetical protein